MLRTIALTLGICATLVACASEAPKENSDIKLDNQEKESADSVSQLGLETVLGFSDVNICVPNTQFEALMAELTPMDDIGQPIVPFQPKISDEYAPFVRNPKLTSKKGEYNVEASVYGTWHGLRLRKLKIWWVAESDHSGFDLEFVESFQKLIETLNRLGFNIPPDGQRTVVDELDTYLQVTAVGAGKSAGSKFSCSS
jgi:hypothetical protein